MAKCKACNEEKVKQPKICGNHTLFIDESGRRWNGKQCPECYKIYNKQSMQKVRQDPSIHISKNLLIEK